MYDMRHLLGLLITAILIALACLAEPPAAAFHGRAGNSGGAPLCRETVPAVRPASI